MRTKSTLLLIFIFVIFGHLKLYGETPNLNQKQKINVQFRLASNTLSQGLTEVTLPNSALRIYVSDKVELSNKDIISADIGTQTSIEPDRYVIELTFSQEGAKNFTKLTRENKNKYLAIFIDKKIISAPLIREEIKGGKAIIAGNFTKQEATRIARGIREGKYEEPEPVKVKDIKEAQTVIEPQKDDLAAYSDDIISFSYDKSFEFIHNKKIVIYTLTRENLTIGIINSSKYISKEMLKDQAEIIKISYRMGTKNPDVNDIFQDMKVLGPTEVKFKKSSGYLVTIKGKLPDSLLQETYLLASQDKTFQVTISLAGGNRKKYSKIISDVLNSVKVK